MPKNLLTQAEGQGLVEYALILVLVAVVVVSTLTLVGPAVGNIFSVVVGHLITTKEAPPECYGSLLLPILVGTTGLGVGLSHLLQKEPAQEPMA